MFKHRATGLLHDPKTTPSVTSGVRFDEYESERIAPCRGRILVIDDNRQLLKLLSMFLNVEGYEAFVSDDVAAGLRVVESARPDIVVLDMVIPHVDAPGVCRRLTQQLRRAAVVAVTDAGCTPDVARAAGADAVMSKPFRLRDFGIVVNDLMTRREWLGWAS